MGGGRQQDQGLRARRQPFRQLCPLTLLGATGPLGHVLTFIDHDDIPVGAVEIEAVIAVVLERVDRHYRLIVIVKGVLIGGYLLANALDTH